MVVQNDRNANYLSHGYLHRIDGPAQTLIQSRSVIMKYCLRSIVVLERRVDSDGTINDEFRPICAAHRYRPERHQMP